MRIQDIAGSKYEIKLTVIKLGVKKLSVKAPIGVYDWEKKEKRKFNINLELDYKIDFSDLKDDLSKTINYEDLVKLVEETIESECNLIETVVNKIGCRIMEKYQSVVRLKIRIKKLNALGEKKIKCAFVEQEFIGKIDI